MSETILEIENLNISFDTRHGILKAVENLGLTLKKGETLGIVGESGCGKSLTNLAIMGLLPINALSTSTKLNFKNIDLNSNSDKEWQRIRGKRISMIFQNSLSSLNPCYKIGSQLDEMIKFNGTKTTKNFRYKLIIETLDKVGIPNPEQRYHSYPHQFSGGMAQRVMIAMAIINSPEILIADEPTTALDVTIQKQILDLLKSIIKETNMSLILVTHDLSVVEYMSDKLIVMYAGVMVEKWPAKKILNNPIHPYTIGLINSKPNLLNLSFKEELPSIKGIVPTLKQKKNGCYFASRCFKASDKCFSDSPTFNNDSSVSCHNIEI